MSDERITKQILLRYELVKARLEIREFFLKTAVKEVYENIGQVLSSVRMQLAFVDEENKELKTKNILQSGELVGQSIRDLRILCRSFYPDEDIIKENGLIDGFQNALAISNGSIGNNGRIKVKGNPDDISPELKLIIFKIFLAIIEEIKEKGLIYKNSSLSYEEERTRFTIKYKGGMIDVARKCNASLGDTILSLKEIVELVDGKTSGKTSKIGITTISLQIPPRNLL